LTTSRADRPLVVLRAEGGAAVGLGHVRRCLALAHALAPHARTRFLLRGDDVTAAVVRRAGVEPLAVAPGIEATLAAAGAVGAAALVVDSYAIDPAALAAAPRGGAALGIVDDAGRFPLAVDVVVNSALGVAPPAVPGDTEYLLGPGFALLAPEFAAAPPARPGREVRRVLVTLGGVTRADVIQLVAGAVRRAIPAELDVVVGPAGDAYERVRAALAGLPEVRYHRAPSGMRPLMIETDLAIAAGGVTVYELAAAGIPTVGIALAANQRPNLEGLAAAGAIVRAGDADDAGVASRVEAAVAALAADRDRRADLARRARSLVDGRGAARVAARLLARVGALEAGRC
jgi:spore coat polysaccharide biosynthesis predicted glycosyltransferase SpsG